MNTLLTYSSSSQQPVEALPAVLPTTRWRWNKVVLWVSLAVSVAVSLVYGFLLNNEVGVFLTLFALVPLAALIVISLWVAPRSEVSLSLRLMAIIWGGVGSTSLTLLIVGQITNIFGEPDLNTAVVVQAATVEEICKGLFLFALFFFARHLVRTPLAGAVLGILVGAGFAFVENIMYFNNAYLGGGWTGLWASVLMRAGMSFFLHAMATMFMGMFIGYVVSHRNNLNIWKKLLFLDMGILASMTVHGMWNGMASLTTVQLRWVVLYILFWVPFVALMAVTLVLIRKSYNKMKADTLTAAARSGYIKISQAETMADKASRKAIYSKSESAQIARWESSVLRIQFWNESLSTVIKDRKVRKLNKAKSKDMMRLAEVVGKV